MEPTESIAPGPLRCPISGEPLVPADVDLCRRLNQAIAHRRLFDRSGRLIELALEGGLVSRAAGVVFPVRALIPQLLLVEAIPLDQLPAVWPEGDRHAG